MATTRRTPHRPTLTASRPNRERDIRVRVAAAARLRRLRQLTVLLAIVAALAASVAGLAWYPAGQAQERDHAAHAALAAATAATQAIFSYDYRQFDASVANGHQFVTGQFAKDYAETTGNLRASAEKEQAVIRAEVSSAGVVQAAPRRVEILVYVNQYRRNINVNGEKVDQNRVVLTMVPVDGEWKVANASAV